MGHQNVNARFIFDFWNVDIFKACCTIIHAIWKNHVAFILMIETDEAL